MISHQSRIYLIYGVSISRRELRASKSIVKKFRLGYRATFSSNSNYCEIHIRRFTRMTSEKRERVAFLLRDGLIRIDKTQGKNVPVGLLIVVVFYRCHIARSPTRERSRRDKKLMIIRKIRGVRYARSFGSKLR